MFSVDEITHEAETLVVRCSGFFGRGSEGFGDGGQLRSSVEGWIDAHPAKPPKRIVVDFRDVDYVWGDWPVAALITVIKKYGTSEIRYLASTDNRQALENLFEVCNLPWFGVLSDPE